MFSCIHMCVYVYIYICYRYIYIEDIHKRMVRAFLRGFGFTKQFFDNTPSYSPLRAPDSNVPGPYRACYFWYILVGIFILGILIGIFYFGYPYCDILLFFGHPWFRV